MVEERIFHNRQPLCRLSKKGALYTDLPPLLKVPLGIYHHDITVVDVALKTVKLHEEVFWRTERYLKRERRADFENKRHIPDGILIFPDGKQVAMEIELTLKDPRRLQEIFKKYALEFDLQEVWYFCSDNVCETLKKVARDFPFIKVFSLSLFLEGFKK